MKPRPRRGLSDTRLESFATCLTSGGLKCRYCVDCINVFDSNVETQQKFLPVLIAWQQVSAQYMLLSRRYLNTMLDDSIWKQWLLGHSDVQISVWDGTKCFSHSMRVVPHRFHQPSVYQDGSVSFDLDHKKCLYKLLVQGWAATCYIVCLNLGSLHMQVERKKLPTDWRKRLAQVCSGPITLKVRWYWAGFHCAHH